MNPESTEGQQVSRYVAGSETVSAVADPVAWLNRVDSTLIACTTRGEVMARIPEILTTEFADWCALSIVADPTIDPPRLTYESTDRDGGLDAKLHRTFANGSDDPDDPPFLSQVFTTDRGHLVDHLDAETTALLGFRADAESDLTELGIHSSLLVPIASDTRTIGALHLLRADLASPFTSYDRSVVQRLAGRIASHLAVLKDRDDNAGLVIRFQEALLPNELPEIPGLDLSVRYWAVGATNQIGGDFYDVFPIRAGRWALVIGDITGHGPDAAAYTALAYHSIRMSAWHGDSPEQVVRWLDRALKADDEHSCTAAVSFLDTHPDGGFRLTSALAGHPRPLVCRADGTVDYFGTWGTVLGTLDSPRALPETTRLGPGEAVLLYTDGITDRPPPHDLTDTRLRAIVRDCWAGGPDANELAGRLLAALEFDAEGRSRRDDVALLVARTRTR